MLEGTLEDGELLPTLRWIAALRQGGLLSVQGEPDLVSVTFDGGAIVAADAMNRPAEEMLGEVLARRGLLDPATYAAAVEPFMGTGRLASEVLGERHLVDRDDLLDAVREQTYGQVMRLLRWDSGNFNWTPKVESPFEVGMRPISIAELLLRASEDLGVEGPLRGRPPGLDEVFQPAAETERPVRTIGRDGEWEPGSADELWLTPAEDRLLVALREHPASGARLAAESGLEPLEVRYGLHELRRVGLVLAMEAAGEPAPADDDAVLFEDGSADPLEPAEVGRGWSALTFRDPVHVVPEPVPEPDPEPALPAAAATVAEDESEEIRPPAFGEPRGTWEPSFESQVDSADALDRVARRPRRGVTLQQTATWLARGLGATLALVVLALLILPDLRSSAILPFPWQREAKATFERSQVTSVYDKIDRAVRTYYLLYGRYPEDLGILVDLELLRGRELFDPVGRWLQYDLAPDGYSLRPVESGPIGTGWERRAELRSDFFLNPQFVELPLPTRNPVVLLD